ncbi:DegT/DnrJ/EryC1/StrS aminotransferase [Kitasatospora xanthocidica]|uniref:DegT/DnrJ/EryC1/StrS aminotransferase n=1 Tax=Kitasatospora xanthocidica TaxID=83382 RepID=A0A373A1G0_9ACTN|nr:DegT/DnrJ/EryC1/StrS family aminotransferase [Kitasatospora xanthocidica]RGD61986.1 DegT/DnrJ/EryC1/StrS aminotransferase [Kitasatospora xanthocidica]
MPTDARTAPRTTTGLRWPIEPLQGGWYTAAEHAAIQEVVTDSASWRTGWKGPQVADFEESFAARAGTAAAVSFNSGGTALEMVLRALDLQPGDEVISCALNFVGTHLPAIHQGGTLVLAEPDPLSLNLDPADTEQRITARTRAIVLTHWNGHVADVRPFLAAAARHPHPVHGPARVIVDAARACGGTAPSGAPVGREGWATMFSFESKKLMTTLGQGGMVTTDDLDLAERLHRLRTYGGRDQWGTNQMLTKAQAAVGLVQLRRLDEMNEARIARAHRRTALLAGTPHLTLPETVHGRRHLYYRYNLLVPEHWAGRGRDLLMETLAADHGVGSLINDPLTYDGHQYISGHTAGQRCPRAEQLAARLLCPVLHPLISPDEESVICQAIRDATAHVANVIDG